MNASRDARENSRSSPGARVAAAVRAAWMKILAGAIAEDQSWEEAGGDSLGMLRLLSELETALGIKLSVDLLSPQMTARSVTASIEAGAPAASAASVARIVFLLPGMYGDEPRLARFRRSFAGRLVFEVIDLPSLADRTRVLVDMSAAGKHVAREIERRQPVGDLYLAGYSFGGGVAFEAARELSASGRRVAFLGILDTAFRHTKRARYLDGLPSVSRITRRLTLDCVDRLMPGIALQARRRMTCHLRIRAMASWRPSSLDVPAWLYTSREFAPHIVGKWRQLCPKLVVVDIAAGHLELFDEAHLDSVSLAFETAVLRA